MQDTRISIEQGDITAHSADAIVNAANATLLGGGGVDGAIHRVGGPEILAACKKIRSEKGKCNPGQAVITTAGRLAAKYVVHTVGPIWHGGDRDEDSILASCYKNSLALAIQNNVKAIAFPSISTGAYGFPVERAATVAMGAVAECIADDPGHIERITWVLFDTDTYEAYASAIAKALDGLEPA
ncbi:MAG: O-acetyl-ADP-ribose deacetylase [Myxococcota bacterium]|nr:O-acetyl-ADP-ribose deacetylase [Myxococcota bacterium]